MDALGGVKSFEEKIESALWQVLYESGEAVVRFRTKKEAREAMKYLLQFPGARKEKGRVVLCVGRNPFDGTVITIVARRRGKTITFREVCVSATEIKTGKGT